MKKLMTIGLAAATLLTLASTVKATALETSGELRERAWYVKNYVIDGKTTEWFDQRLRLSLTWPVAEGVRVNVRADILEGMWGENIPQVGISQNADGTFTSRATGIDTKNPIQFDHVNMQFVWPGAPLTFIVGRQDVSWGAGFLAAKDNRDRFKVIAKFAPELSVGFMYDKNKELFGAHDSSNNNDDARAYTLAFFGDVPGWKYGVLGLYNLDETTPDSGSGVIKRWAFDGYAIGKAGPVDLKVEVAYMTGSNQLNGKAKVDQAGIGAYAMVAVPAGPVKIALEGAYASGNDPKTAKNEGALRADYDSDFWSIILYNNLQYPGYLGSGTGNAVTSDYAGDTGLTNAAAGKLSFTMSPAKGFTVILAGVFAQALEDVVVTTTPAKAATATTPAVPAVTKTYKSDSLGTEFDLVAVYNITDNVYFLGGVGYLVAGNFFGDVKNPLGVMGSLNVKF
jgi:hypothetical protein